MLFKFDVIYLAYLLVSMTHAAPNRELWLGVGAVRTLSAARGAPVRVGARGVVRVLDGDRSIRVIAVKPGVTTLVVGARDWVVRVTSERQRRFVEDLRARIANFRGLALDLDGARPEVTGTLLRFDDWLALAEVARRHGGEYGFSARVLEDVGRAALAHLGALARERGLPLVRFAVDPAVTAVVPRTARAQRPAIERTLAAYGVRVRETEGDLPVEPLVRTSVVMAEVSRDAVRDFGLRWPGEYAGQVLPRPAADNRVLASLRALESSGRAQVLANPDLSCRSGGEARFLAGGELPIRIATLRSAKVEWKNFGVLLRVRPRADYHGAIRLDVRTEISMIDPSRSIDGVPALRKTEVESQFDLVGRRTVALSGLIRRDLADAHDGLPWLSEIPFLGRLFSSAQYRRHRSDLVVFVTPEIVNPAEDLEPTMPAGWSQDAD